MLIASGSNSPENGPSAFIKREKYWLEQSKTVYIQINAQRYKLPCDQLAAHSLHLADVFNGLRDAQVAVEEVDGLPLYRLDGLRLSPKDFEAFLDAVHNAITFAFDPPSFSAVASILRAADALQAPRFMNWALKQIAHTWEFTFDAISDRSARGQAIEAAYIAKKYHLPEVLKRALYDLIRGPEFHCHSSSSTTKSLLGRKVLNLADHRRLVAARENLVASWFPLLVYSQQQLEGCADEECIGTAEQLFVTRVADEYKFDPLFGLGVVLASEKGAFDMCDACIQARAAEWERRKREIWTQVTAWLGFL